MKRREFITRVLIGAGSVGITPLTLPAFAQERRYLTEEQALRLVFNGFNNVVKEQKELSESQLDSAQKRLGSRPLRSQTVYRRSNAGATDGYAMIVNEIGKEQYITFIVGITNDFKVNRVALMVFRESRGAEVEDSRFTNQFRGKTSRDRLLIGADIVGITGATLSSRAFCRGAKRALVICELLYRV
ncbi:MAG: FMN-binding protein [Blastocatellia bacterium AA13]|nr:MAG: FMN-binding protein [Blastocatellia bacterium AA13]